MSADLNREVAADFADIDSLRERLRSAGAGYARAEVAVEVNHTSKTGTSARLDVIERTKLHFAKPQAGAPSHEEYRLAHTLTFTNLGGDWQLAGAEAHVGEGVVPATQVGNDKQTRARTDDVPGAARNSDITRVPQSALAGQAPVKTAAPLPAYDYAAMLNYALTYWDVYNTDDYRSFDNDCTNFISQIVETGGWQHVAGFYQNNEYWWYNFLNQTYTWAGAENWYWFAQHHSGRTVFLPNVWQMVTTDVLQMDFDGTGEILDHTMFVTGRAGSGEYANELYLTYHTNDTLNRTLSSIIAQYGSATYYTHRT